LHQVVSIVEQQTALQAHMRQHIGVLLKNYLGLCVAIFF
jgi:hypothetical protein